MRGNEGTITEMRGGAGHEFLIPMRGNEVQRYAFWNIAEREIPNPHEG